MEGQALSRLSLGKLTRLQWWTQTKGHLETQTRLYRPYNIYTLEYIKLGGAARRGADQGGGLNTIKLYGNCKNEIFFLI